MVSLFSKGTKHLCAQSEHRTTFGARLLHEHYGASEVKIVLEKNIKCDKLRSDLKTTGAGFPHITLTIMEG